MLNKPTAIVADDSPTFLMYFSTLLNRMNFDVIPVQSGEEAFDLARIVSPRLITLDVTMPGQSGIQTLEKIRNDSLLAKTPVVMVSSSTRYSDECNELGCCDYLTKPIDLQKLHNALQVCQPRPENKRMHIRAPFNKMVSCCVNGKYERNYAVTLSEGGIYLRSTKPLPVDTRVEVDIPLGDKESMVLCGRVIYTKELLKGRFTIPPGMAIRFDECESEMQKRLREEVIHLLAGDIVQEQPEQVIELD